MPSQVSGFEYDVFISYRQKDNKGERWVSEFVEALKTELESTFKEEISVYIDNNPNDGLLDTHDVDASLKRKLKCLVFIPVISRTYCDPNSFAWEHEFKAFIDLASSDQFGLKIALPSGNVMSRVLPVRIHDLDKKDVELCESLLKGNLRGVDFVYKSSGVNRPLRGHEDHPHDNLNKTYYRDQINKLSNSIKEIIESLSKPDEGHLTKIPETKKSNIRAGSSGKFPSRTLGRKILMPLLIFIVLISASVFSYQYFKNSHQSNSEKTIAIIPLTNPPNDPELTKYAIGSMDAIITKLQGINSLTVRSRLSSLQYLDTKKPQAEIRKELNSNYLVVLNISKTGNNLKMWIGLTKTSNDEQLWAGQYDWNEEQLMPLFTKVVQTIGGNLNIKFTNQEIINIEKDLTKNADAYVNYLTASAGLISAMGNKSLDSTRFRTAIDFYDKAIDKDPEFANAYARRAIALSWGIHTGEVSATNKQKCWSDINIASKINDDLPDVQIARGFYYYYVSKDYTNALMSFNVASEKDPQSYLPIFYMAMVYKAMGNWKEVQSLLHKVTKFNLQDPLVLTNIGLCFEYLHNFDSALIYHQKAINVNRDWDAAYQNKLNTLLLKNPNTSEAHSLIDTISTYSTDKHMEQQIMLDMYDGKYFDALIKAKKSKPDDFSYKGVRSLYLGNISLLLNDKISADKYFGNAVDEFQLELKIDTSNTSIHGLIGLALAGGNNEKEALDEGNRAIESAIKNKNKILESEMILNMAEIYTKLGMFNEALTKIEDSLKNPSLFSIIMLEHDPVWKPLMSRPELKNLIAKYDRK